MAGSLNWDLEEQEGGQRVKLAGEITETANLGELLARLSGAVLLDTAGVRRINSTGVREWVEFVRGARGKGITLVLERCSVAFVHQLNLNAIFRGQSAVRSVYAPYFCPQCNAEHALLIDLDSAPRIEPEPPCPTCGSAMEFDDLPDKYLAFHAPH